MSKTVLKIFFAVGSLVSAMACQNQSRIASQDPLAKQYQHIDRGEYNIAIDELNELSQHDPRPEVLTTLASAYAARGGIKVTDYWGFVIGFKAPLLNTDNVLVNPTLESLQKISRQAKGEMTVSDLDALGGVVRAAILWDLYKSRIDAIPVVEGAAKTDLQSATGILLKVQTPGGRLYRAILNLILFKSAFVASPDALKDITRSLEKIMQENPKNLCRFDLEKFADWEKPLSSHLRDTLEDLSVAFPDQNENWVPAQKQLEKLDGEIYRSRFKVAGRKGCS